MKNCNSEIYWEFIVGNESAPIDVVAFERILDLGDKFHDSQVRVGSTKHYHYWKFKTPEIQSISPRDVIDPFLIKLSKNIDELSNYVLLSNSFVKFYLVIKYHSGSIPCMIITEQFIDICHKLNATIEEDVYSDFEEENVIPVEINGMMEECTRILPR